MKYLKMYENFNTDNFGMEESQFGAEEIIAKWHEKFGENGNPSTQDKYDFYADLREEGFDGILIFDTLGDKMNNDVELDESETALDILDHDNIDHRDFESDLN